jgi:equilibrative nucleoside transporter 1/2/3
LPWNALISSVGYFSEMLCIGLDQSECFADAKSQQFAFYMSIAYNIPSIPLLLLSTVFAERISFKTRIIACFAGEFIVFVLVCVVVSLSLPLATPILTENDAFWAMLALTFFSGCFSALLFGAILSFTALFPPNYTTAVMSGNGIAGIIAGLLRVITLAALPDTDSGSKTSSLIFFGITTTIFGVCIASFISMLKNSFVVHHMGTSPLKSSGDGETELLMGHAGTSTVNMKEEVSAWEVQKKIWVPSLSVFSVFFITLSLFPGMIYDICPSSTGKIQNVEWFGVLLVVCLIYPPHTRTTLSSLPLYSIPLTWVFLFCLVLSCYLFCFV